jgi:ubiquinone biosynthesis protein
VAEVHIESGWAPPETRVDAFETAIRAVCEPIFAKPLKDISFGRVLLRLFQTSRRFNIEVQPQLVMLQKTLLNIEGLGRELDPELDLWATAKPYLEKWMSEQVGWRGLLRHLKTELPFWSHTLPQLPRLLHRYLEDAGNDRVTSALQRLADETRDQNTVLALIAVSLIALSGLLLYIAH